ncbi:SH3 domain-containing protein [Archangium gephyra]|uniref:SH3 domain-containing protein n=1 Tax=Archangium gephyra TaxID=48 RepID=UPI003B7B2638
MAQDAGVAGPRVYVQGSSINLRKEPTKDAEVLQKLQIGTECLVSERLEGGQWLKVRCGEVEGYASAPLLGPEKPSVEKLKAEAMNPALPLAQREESALRAAMLAPEDAGLHEELGKLFFERNLDFVARLKKPLMRRRFSFSCSAEDAARCLNGTSSIYLNGIKVRVQTKNDAFVTALGVTDKVVVYRGKYRFNAKTGALTGEVLEQVEFPLTPVFEKALFSGVEVMQGDERDPPFGRYFLDEASLALLADVPRTWGLLTMQDARGPRIRWDSCARRPYQLQFRPDIHGRVLVYIENADTDGLEIYWISSLSKREKTLDLTLEAFYGSKTRHELFRLPETGEDIAYLGNTPYTHTPRFYPDIGQPCIEGGP